MSMTKSEPRTAVKTFASLRFKGDRLEPERVTEILDAAPTTSYRKGDVYKRSRGHAVQGRTGLWLLSSKGRVSSADLNDHLEYFVALLFPAGSEERVRRLRELMRDGQVEADIGIFWHGEPGTSPPIVPASIRKALKKLPVSTEMDALTG
jgi:hypothetical protein